MRKQSMTGVALEGLAMYAAERQAGFEPHQADPAYSSVEQREGRIKDILRGMAELWSDADPEEVTAQFTERLEAAQGCAAVEAAPLSVQKETMEILGRYASALARRTGDPRPALKEMAELLKEIWDYRAWDGLKNGVLDIRSQIEEDMVRVTARQSIRFTRVLIGPEMGPCGVDYLPGLVKTQEQVRQAKLFQHLSEEYPARREWPALCVFYGAGKCIPTRDASAEDIEIIRGAGDRFLNLPGVHSLSGIYEIQINEEPAISVFHVTERGVEEWFRTQTWVEFLDAAELLRKYDSNQTPAHSFAELFPDREQLTQEQFEELEIVRQENTGKVAGAFEIDLDAGQFSALNIMDGWLTYGVQDIKAAARQAFRDDDMDRSARWRVLLDDLEGKEITFFNQPSTPQVLGGLTGPC